MAKRQSLFLALLLFSWFYQVDLVVSFVKVTVPDVNIKSINPPFMTQLPNGNIFLLGNSALLTKTYEFNPIANTMVQRASLLKPIFDIGCVLTASNGEVYALGGLLQESVPDKVNPFVQIYNPSTNQWRFGRNMTTPRNRLGCAYDPVKKNIHVLGGFDISINDGAPHEIYNTVSNTWRSASNPPNTNHGRLGRGYYEPKSASIVFLGGAFTREQSVYNTNTAKWTTWAPMPVDAYYFGLTALSDRILTFGGQPTPVQLTYTFATNKWTQQPMNDDLSFFHNTAVVGGSVYLMTDASMYKTYCQVPENCETTCTSGCVIATGECKPANDGRLCNDFNNCTIGDKCFGGQCMPGNQTAVTPECLPPIAPEPPVAPPQREEPVSPPESTPITAPETPVTPPQSEEPVSIPVSESPPITTPESPVAPPQSEEPPTPITAPEMPLAPPQEEPLTSPVVQSTPQSSIVSQGLSLQQTDFSHLLVILLILVLLP